MAELESSGTRNLESDGRAFGEPADPSEVTEVPREDGTEKPAGATNEDPLTRTREMAQEGKRGNPSNGDNVENCPPPGLNQRDPKEGNGNEQIEQPGSSKEPDLGSITEEYRTRFYEMYRHQAEEYDKGFIKKCDADLNTTLIFAGLFSAVASAFIILVQSDFKQDPNEETAALLRIIIYKMDNTTLGGDVPAVPQWTGPPHTSVEVQAMLFASLTASLFSAFLAMLGKQWVNRYESIDVRGSAIERCKNRQQKLDGTVTWYFNPVMESLPLMLQGALFLLGCALSRYIWEINTSVALVILCGTSFGLLSYLFIAVVGAAYTSCPYQTPAAQFLRYVLDALAHTPNTLRRISSSLRRIPSTLRRFTEFLDSILFTPINTSFVHDILIELRVRSLPRLACSFILILLLPVAFLLDTCRILIAMIHKVYQLVKQPEWHTTVLEQRCALWILQTSLDRHARLLALDYLSMVVVPHPNPALIVDCFDNLGKTSCGRAEIMGEWMEFVGAYSLCCLSMLSHLTVRDPSRSAVWDPSHHTVENPFPKILEDISERYARVISPHIGFYPLPILHVISRVLHAINPIVPKSGRPRWDIYKPTSNEHVIAAHALAKISHFEFRTVRPQKAQKVPRHLLRFALHSLSLDPPPPTSVIANSLFIIAIDLGCNVNAAAPDKSLDRCLSLITKKLNTMIKAGDSNPIFSKHKAINALLPYAVTLEQRGQPALLDLFLRAAQSTKFENFIWFRPLTNTLFSTPYPRSLDRIILLATPHAWQDRGPRSEDEVVRWALAASAVPHTEELGGSVVSALLRVAADDSLRRCVPANVWAWLKKLPSPQHVTIRQWVIAPLGAVRHVRGLGDIEILKSYFLVAWRSRRPLDTSGFAEMKVSIVEDFAGVGMSRYRGDLIKELEDARVDFLGYSPRGYGELKKLLLQVDMEAEKTLTSSHLTFMCALPLPCS